MKKIYRNAVRSKKMIRRAYFELLTEKQNNSITVTDIVTRADLTRNTFYAHYRDISAVPQEYLMQFLEKFDGELSAKGGSSLLRSTAGFARLNRSDLLLLIKAGLSAQLAAGMKQVLTRKFREPGDCGFPETVLAAAVCGMIDLAICWAQDRGNISLESAADELTRLLQPPTG